MTVLRTRRAGLVACFAVFVFTMAPIVSAQDSTPPADHEAHHVGTPIPVGTPAATEAEPFDLMFIDMMILHHEGAVAMAQVALERGEHPEIVQLAEEIISAQKREITQLWTWREQWYPDAPELSMDQMMGGTGSMMEGMSGMDMMDPSMAADIVRAAPEPFDLALINAMIPHHLSALMMAEMAVQQAIHPELTAAAQAMFELQEQEIATLRSWRAEWYATATTANT